MSKELHREENRAGESLFKAASAKNSHGAGWGVHLACSEALQRPLTKSKEMTVGCQGGRGRVRSRPEGGGELN